MDKENNLKIFEDKNIKVQWDAEKENGIFLLLNCCSFNR